MRASLMLLFTVILMLGYCGGEGVSQPQVKLLIAVPGNE